MFSYQAFISTTIVSLLYSRSSGAIIKQRSKALYIYVYVYNLNQFLHFLNHKCIYIYIYNKVVI